MSKKRFLDLNENEKIELIIHRHWSVLTKSMIKAFFLAMLPVFLFLIFYFFFPALLEQPYSGLFLFIGALYLLFLWTWIFWKIVDYYLDSWIITNQRIIDSEQLGLFRRVSSTLNLTAIQDVTTEVNGISATFFRFGDLFIQTAGEKERFSIKKISQPDKVKAIIIDLCHHAATERGSAFLGHSAGTRQIKESGGNSLKNRPKINKN